MSDVQKATETQLANIAKRSGKSLAELAGIIKSSGFSKHSELRGFAQREFGLGYGDANALVHYALGEGSAAAAVPDKASGDVLDEIYTGPKAALRPIHEALMREIDRLGGYEVAPKKGYVSLRRNKQFAMIGPATKTQVELGLNMKGVPATERLVELPPGGMCNYRVRLAGAGEVDAEVIAWMRTAYDSAG